MKQDHNRFIDHLLSFGRANEDEPAVPTAPDHKPSEADGVSLASNVLWGTNQDLTPKTACQGLFAPETPTPPQSTDVQSKTLEKSTGGASPMNAFENDIHTLLAQIQRQLEQMTREERLKYFKNAYLPDFLMHDGGSIYIVRTHYGDTATESLQEKTERILSK